MYNPPEIHRHDRVIFSPAITEFENQEKTHIGSIERVYPDGVCDIIVFFPGGNRGMECCRHFEDPYVKEHPDFIKEADTGVYRLADSEVQQRFMYDKLVALETLVADESKDRRNAFGSSPPPVDVNSPKRKRGRPRKEDK